MATSELTPTLDLSLTVLFPGGTAAKDLRVLGFRDPIPSTDALQPGEVVSLRVAVANDHPSRSYPVSDAVLRQKEGAAGGVNVADTITVQRVDVEPLQEAVVLVQIKVAESGRGAMTGHYAVVLVAEEPAA